MVQKVAILQALRSVKDPELERDIVSLNFIADVKIEGNNVIVYFRPDTAKCPLLDQFTAEIKRTVSQVEGVQKVDVVIEKPKQDEPVNSEEQFGGVQDLNHVKRSCCHERKGRRWKVAGHRASGSISSEKRVSCWDFGRRYHGSKHS